MKTYFLERCSGGTKSGDFWKTIKPFFSKKGSSGEQNIVLNESDKIVNDQKEVANHFNNIFSTVAENIGKDTVYDPSDHPSLIEIKKQNDCTNKFVFEKVTTDKVEKIINNIYIKKATGADGIPAKIIKCSKSIIAPQITSILNMSIDQIKINGILSSWSDIQKGVPQGSILEPLLFNVFINDIFYFVKKGTLYNYADDNTLSYGHPDFNVLTSVLESESNVLINWFKVNKMQANPDKFQVLAVGKKTFDKNMKICIQNSTLSCEEKVKLLGIEIDYQLNFDIHISSICRKASQQLNILKRLGRYLDRLSKLTIFHTFILSNFNFCPLAWHFCTDKNSKKLEKVQERAHQFIYRPF